MMRRILRDGLFAGFGVFASVTAGLLLIEGVLRVHALVTNRVPPAEPTAWLERPGSLHQWEAQRGWALRPGFRDADVQVNAIGLRSSEDAPLVSTESRERLLLVGDSMTFGLGVSQPLIFSELLRRDLPMVRVLNAGVQGYSNVQEYLTMKKYLPQTMARWTVLFVCQDNDFLTNVRPDRFYPAAEPDGLSGLRIRPPSRINPVPAYKDSYLWRSLNARFLAGKDLTYLWHRMGMALWEEESYVIEMAKLVFAEISRLSRQQDTRLILVDIPTQNQLRGRVSGLRSKVLKEIAEAQKAAYYDLAIHYPSHYEPLFLPNDAHWSPRGHRFIADFVRKILVLDGLQTAGRRANGKWGPQAAATFSPSSVSRTQRT
jgi:hypothetical protein